MAGDLLAAITEAGEVIGVAPSAAVFELDNGSRDEARFLFDSAAPSGNGRNDKVHGAVLEARITPVKGALIFVYGAFAPGFTTKRMISSFMWDAGFDCFCHALPRHMRALQSSPAAVDSSCSAATFRAILKF